MSSEVDAPQAPSNESAPPTPHAARWHSDLGLSTSGRVKALAFGSCLLAVLLGGFAALTSLPASKPKTTLVSLYLAPPSSQCAGVDAPHPPLMRPLFGLAVANVVAAAPPEDEKREAAKGETEKDEKNGKDESDVKDAKDGKDRKAAGVSAEKRLTDWRATVAGCSRSHQLVLHVSSLARVDNGQVFFYGLEGRERQERLVSLTDVMETLKRCDATSKLLVLEVQWPLIRDAGDGSQRLSELDTAIKHQFRQFADPDCHLLLASSGSAACRALPEQPVTALGHFLTDALQSGHADSDHNGRITLDELVDWSAPRIASDGLDHEQPQKIAWLAGSTSFQFMELPIPPQPSERIYPSWLTQAQKRRQAYIEDPRLPWDGQTVVRWGQLLHDIESGWRRGESEIDLQRRLTAQEHSIVDSLQQGIVRRSEARADSLRLAALRVATPIDRNDEPLAAALLAKHAEIMQNVPADKRDAQVAEAVKQYVAHYQTDDAVVAMAELLQMFDNKALNDLQSLALVQQVNQACQPPLTYPVLDAVDRLIAMDAQPLRVQAVVQIFRLQGQLGTDPVATAILGDVIDNAMRQLILAQRLVWNPGLTDNQQVRRHVEVAVNTASMALVAEQSLAHAIRQLQRMDAAISTDVLSGLAWHRSEHFQEIERHTQKLLQAIERMRSTAQQTGMVKSGELAMVRQASESLQREWAHVQTNQRGHATSANALRLVSARPAARLTAFPLQPMLDQLSAGASAAYHKWCQAYLSASSQIEVLPSYRRIAEMQLIAPNQHALPVVVSGSLNELSWNQPKQQIELRYAVDLDDAAPVQYKILAPASASLQVTPTQGVLPPGGECTIDVRLDREATAAQDTTLNGLWLCLQRGEQQHCTPLRMAPQPSAPAIDIEFGGHVTRDGCRATLHLWPNTQPQPQNWTIRTHDCTVPAAVATLSSSDGTTLRSAPIPLPASGSVPIHFLPAQPAPAAGANSNPAAPSAAAAESSSGLKGPLTLELTDPAKGATLGQWQITAQLKDPRRILELGWAEYKVQSNGHNRLEVSLARTPTDSDTLKDRTYAPTVRLALEPETIAPLLGFASSQLQTGLPPSGQAVKLYATDLRFREGGEPLISIPLQIDGDSGYCVLEGRFPRRRGTVQLNWQRNPSLAIEAAEAITSSTPLQVKIPARNLVDSQALRLDLFNDSDREHPVWHTELGQARHADVGFRGGGQEHTVEIIAVRRDWQIDVPTQLGNGPHQLRVSTVQPVGIQPIAAQHSFVIDDAQPRDVVVRAVRSSQATEVTVSMRPGISGVRSVSLVGVSTGKEKKATPLDATADDESGRRWSLRWPQGLELPEKMRIELQTGAGKSCSVVCDVQVQTLKPVGIVDGTVLEGTLAQPGLTVEVAKPKARSFARVQTDSNGRYQFALSPGRYVLKTEKPATGRNADAEITVADQGQVHADLHLHP